MTFDSSTIYCLATGRPIAQVSDDEFGLTIEAFAHLPADTIDSHLERLALLSMRPGLAWMNSSPQMLESMRVSAPRQLLAYLMNRMYAPIDAPKGNARPQSLDSTLQARRTRIAIWQSIESATISDTQLDSILYVLLELDSRFNLAKLRKPTAIVELWQSWSAEAAMQFIESLWDWRAKLVAEHEKALRMAKASEAFWSEGNRLTRKAMLGQFTKVTPPSPTQAAKTAKAAKTRDTVDFLDALEAELTQRPEGSHSSTPTLTSCNPKPVAPVRLTRFGKKG
jgi:hypothetical protein